MRQFLLLVVCLTYATYAYTKADSIIADVGDFKYIIWHDSLLQWKEALNFCEQQNMKLLSLENEKKNKELSNYLRAKNFTYEQKPGIDHIYWTSGHYIPKYKKFHWEAIKKDFKETNFTNWLPKEPDNWRGDEYCIEMGFQKVGKWNDVRCWYHRHFICERSKLKEIEAA